MTTPRNRFTIAPFIVAFFTALIALPATAVVKVNAFGMGTEHEQPWARKTNGLTATFNAARSILARFGERLAELQRHALFRPALGAIGILVALHQQDGLMAAPFLMGALTEGQHAGEFIMGERSGIGSPSRETITVLSGQDLSAGAVIGRVSKGIGRVSIPTVVGTGTGTVTNVFAGPEVEVGSYVMTCTEAVAHGGVFSLTTPSGKALRAVTMTPGSGGTTNYRSRHLNFTVTDATDFIVGDVFTFVVSTTAPTVIGGTGTGTISGLALGPNAKPGNYRAICTEAISNGGRFQVYRGGPNGGVSIGSFLLNAGSTNATSFETDEISFTITDATDFIVGNYFDVCVFNNLAGGKVVAWDPTTYDGRHEAVGGLYDNVDATSADTTGAIVTRDAVFMKSALQWGASITAAQKESAYLDLAKRGIVCR